MIHQIECDHQITLLLPSLKDKIFNIIKLNQLLPKGRSIPLIRLWSFSIDQQLLFLRTFKHQDQCIQFHPARTLYLGNKPNYRQMIRFHLFLAHSFLNRDKNLSFKTSYQQRISAASLIFEKLPWNPEMQSIILKDLLRW